jgi:hypothetical protein
VLKLHHVSRANRFLVLAQAVVGLVYEDAPSSS